MKKEHTQVLEDFEESCNHALNSDCEACKIMAKSNILLMALVKRMDEEIKKLK